MVIGLSTACFYGRRETEDTFEILKELGADCAEVFLQTFYEYRPEFAKKYAQGLQGIKVNSVHVFSTNIEPSLFCPTRRSRGDGFYWLDQVMRSAQLLDAGNYSFHGIARKGSGGNDDFNFLGGRIAEVCNFCQSYGVNVCLENVSWGLYNRPGVFKELKARCPQLFGVFDIKQARSSGYPWQMYVKEMQGSISHAHLSDVDENGRMCLPGRGIYDFKEIFKVLKDAGFDGSVIIEAYSRDYGAEEELKTSLEYLKEISI